VKHLLYRNVTRLEYNRLGDRNNIAQTSTITLWILKSQMWCVHLRKWDTHVQFGCHTDFFHLLNFTNCQNNGSMHLQAHEEIARHVIRGSANCWTRALSSSQLTYTSEIISNLHFFTYFIIYFKSTCNYAYQSQVNFNFQCIPCVIKYFLSFRFT